MTPQLLATRLDKVARAVQEELQSRIDRLSMQDRLTAAIRHAVLAGGKRIRPFLVVESARFFGIEGAVPLAVGTALECVHCYSLVHDDLPSMDNDDLRRGQPTLHRAFDEATAILAGDALLTLAFEILADRRLALPPARKLRLVSDLARASGEAGMVGGQMLDLAAEGRFAAPGMRHKPLSRAAIRRLQALKTGALITFAATAGATMAPRASAGEKRALKAYGDCLGLAFQIQDDLLDIEGNAATMGKAVAKDAGAGKATFAGLLGIEGARKLLDETNAKARNALESAFGAQAETLVSLLDFNAKRQR